MLARAPKRDKSRYRLVLVAGARPNFVKAAALLRAFSAEKRLETTFVHTGQHYDEAMSGAFLRDLGVAAPDIHLRVGSGTHAVQTGRVMQRLEAYLTGRAVDRLIVVGDVNSTLAAALVGAKLGIPVDHVEAGLRSRDRGMPEEINRIATDTIASRLFVSEPSGVENLRREGHPASSIHHVGNVMIDSLKRLLPQARRAAHWKTLGLAPRGYAVITLHRPSNVDVPERLRRILEALARVRRRLPVVFPVHPRTARRLRDLPGPRPEHLHVTPALGYREFLSLVSGCRVVITDSGGIQEETTFLRIPCLTLRDTTERPVTVRLGTNTLVRTPERLGAMVDRVLRGSYKKGRVPALWDGRAAFRIARILAR